MAFAVVMALGACSQSGPRTVEPFISFANTTSIDIVKAELTDSNTVLHINAHYRPGYWIKIAGDTYLEADGKQYAMIGTEGIEPGSEFWMPESREADFKLFFEPLPFSTKQFDFIEGKDPGAFKLWNVDITGKPLPEFPDGLPAEFKREPVDGPVPAPRLEIGRTTVNFHLLPYRPEFGDEYFVYLNSMDGGQEEYSVKFDDKGNGTISFDQYGPAEAFLVNSETHYGYATLNLSPGETVDCYVDMRKSGSFAMSNRKDFDTWFSSFHNGYYRDLNLLQGKNHKYYGMQLYTGDFADYHMTGQQYKDMVKSLYDALSDSIQAADASQMQKEYMKLQLQNQVLKAIADYRYFLGHNYRNVKGDWRSHVPQDSIIAHLDDADFAEVATWFDLSDPRLLMFDNSIGAIDWNKHGVPGDLSRSLNMYSGMIGKARDNKLDAADLDSLHTLSDPFFAAACDSINQRSLRECLRLQERANVTPTPDVATDRIFDAIVAPHKGKVVVVDLWNTWCAPCRAALKANEPLKDGELSSEDIVWIYIADESSEQAKYLGMIPDIRGIHYKVTSEQIAAIRDRFSVDGIPYYIFVDREGKAQGRPDFRDHNIYVETIKAAL